MKTTLTKEEKKIIDEYWNVPAGTHFYKDELIGVVAKIRDDAVIKAQYRLLNQMIDNLKSMNNNLVFNIKNNE